MRSILFAVLGAALLVAPAAAQTKAKPAKVRGFSVGLAGYATLALPVPSQLATPKPYREKDVLLSMPVAWQDRATAPADIKVKVAGYDWTIKAGDQLTRATFLSGGNLESLSKDAVVYCGDSFKKKGGVEAHLLTLGLSSLGSRLSNWLQVCAVDSDVDGQFDQGFLVGTKKAPDRTLVPVEPVPYTAVKLEPIPDSHLDVVYYDGGALHGANFELHLFVNGTRMALGGIGFPDNSAPPEILKDKASLKKWEAETPSSLGWFFPIRSKQIPQKFTVGNAQFTVHAIDKLARTATITLDKDPTGFPFNNWVQPTTYYIYVYIPG